MTAEHEPDQPGERDLTGETNPGAPEASDTGADAPGASPFGAQSAPESAPFGEAEGAPGDSDAPGQEAEGPEGETVDIAAIVAENAELKDRLLRAAAEMENLRRRAEREKTDAKKFGIANFARDLLSVADNLSRALSSASGAEDGGDAALVSVLEGVQMTEKDLISVLERHGVRRVEPKGERFDPNLHQAVAEVPGSGEPSGVVVDVAQTGFVIEERVLRAAMVTVSNGKGGAGEDGAGQAEPPQPGGSVDTSA